MAGGAGDMLTTRLYLLQRITALIMAPLVLGHLALMIYAVQGGLDSAEILGRTQGSILWTLFYGSFVVAVSIHAAIGIRVVAFEILGLSKSTLSPLTWFVFFIVSLLGLRAVYAVTLSGVGL